MDHHFLKTLPYTFVFQKSNFPTFDIRRGGAFPVGTPPLFPQGRYTFVVHVSATDDFAKFIPEVRASGQSDGITPVSTRQRKGLPMPNTPRPIEQERDKHYRGNRNDGEQFRTV
ncbi:hypothetical protein ACWKWK_16645 [Pseudoxanthomonas beigongshangi]